MTGSEVQNSGLFDDRASSRSRRDPTNGDNGVRRLLNAALTSFSTRGFHASTTRDISSLAGMSPGAIYAHYKKKSDLLYEIVREGHEVVYQAMQEAFAQPAGPAERVRNVVVAHVKFHTTFHTAGRVGNYEFHSLPEADRQDIIKRRSAISGLVREAIRMGINAGELHIDDLDIATTAVMSLGIDAARWFDDTKEWDADRVAQTYGDLVLVMLGASPAIVAACAKASPKNKKK